CLVHFRRGRLLFVFAANELAQRSLNIGTDQSLIQVMEGDVAGSSECTKGSVEQDDLVKGASLARYLVKKHSDHDLDHIKEKESVNIDVAKSRVSKEETELGQNNNVESIVSLHNTGKEKNKLVDLKREKAMQTCINNVSEISLSENKVEEHQDLSLDFKDRNSCVMRQMTQKKEHVLEMPETVHSKDYIYQEKKTGNTGVDRTVSSNFVSVRGKKIVNKIIDLLIFFMSSYFPGNQLALPVKEIQVCGSGSNPQVNDSIQSLSRIVHRMQADQGSQGAFIEQCQRGFCFPLEPYIFAVFNSDNIFIVAEHADFQVFLCLTSCQLLMIEIQANGPGKLQSMRVESQNYMNQLTRFSGRETSTALCHSKLKAVLPHEDRNLNIPKLLEPNFNHPYPDKKSHGKQCRREKC
ncbi:hypothetical protein ACJMK2_028433, partial [Sinanodonta woodiana]